MSTPADCITSILELARWTPSGDNMQTWRFEILGPRRLAIHGWDTRDHCVYDREGHASQLALGALLENVRLAATRFQLRPTVRQRANLPATRPTFDIDLAPDPAISPDPLVEAITTRAVQRRPMRTRRLTEPEKGAMAAALGDRHRVIWIETPAARLRMARLLFRSAKIRLTIPEAYRTHAAVIEWNARYSESRIPDQAVGLDPVSLRLMRWAMASWARIEFLNRYAAGTLLPRVQLDFVPGLACAGHFLLVAREPPEDLDDYLAAGGAWLRFWLTATRLTLWQQPEMTPLIFSRYAERGIPFTGRAEARRLAGDVRARLVAMFGEDTLRRAVVLGRVGAGPAPTSRSLRLPLRQLILSAPPTPGSLPP